MGLVSLKCTNCGGSIQLDDKKEFGFCMHCGHKAYLSENIPQTVKFDNSHSIKNWERLADNARETDNMDDLRKYAEKILEADSENIKGWLLMGCVSARNGDLDNAAVHWRTGLSFVSTAETLEECFLMIQKDLLRGMIKLAIGTFDDLNFGILWSKVIKDIEVETEDAWLLFRLISNANNYIIGELSGPAQYENINSNVFYKLYKMIYVLIEYNLKIESNCGVLLKKVQYYSSIINEFNSFSKTITIDVPNGTGELYYKKEAITDRISADASIMTMLAAVSNQILSKISFEESAALSDYWGRNSDEFFNNVGNFFIEGLIEYRNGCDSLFGKKQKISGQHKIEYYLTKLARRQ